MANLDLLCVSVIYISLISFTWWSSVWWHGLFLFIVISSKIPNWEASIKAPSLSYCSWPDEPVFTLSRHLFAITALFLPTSFQASGSVFLISQLEWLEFLPFNSFQPKIFILGIGVEGECWQDRSHASRNF